MKIDINKFPKALFLYSLIFMINLIQYNKNHNVKNVNSDIIIKVLAYSFSSFFLLGILIFLISLVNLILTKKLKWCYNYWMLIIIIFFETLKIINHVEI